MATKPKFLGPEYAAAFQDRGVAEAYQHRTTYPPDVFPIVAELIVDAPRVVLDVGAGTGDVARNLVSYVDRIDAVDFSREMIDEGRRLPHGDDPRLTWIYGRAEDAPLWPPYALITAGQSLHWMDWNIVLPRFHDVLTPHGVLALVSAEERPAPWGEAVGRSIRRFSTNQDYEPFDMLAELERRGLWEQRGERRTEPITIVRSVDDYIASFHAMSSLSRRRMGLEQAAAFDEEIRAAIMPFAVEGRVQLEVEGAVVWGRPLRG
jgi:SAM-dependent methyltransferase